MMKRKKNDSCLLTDILCGMAEMVITMMVYVGGGLILGLWRVILRMLQEARRGSEATIPSPEALDFSAPEEEEDEEEDEWWEDEELGLLLDEEDDSEDEDEGFSHLLHGRTIEKATADEERRLLALYRRKDKLEYVNKRTAEEWDRFQQTKTWRGLLWDIEDAEERLARLEKAAV